MAIATTEQQASSPPLPVERSSGDAGIDLDWLPSGFPIVVIKSVSIAASARRAVRLISRPATRTTAREVGFT